MATFRVNQRVRCVRRRVEPMIRPYDPHPAIFLGCAATVVGTPSNPNLGFAPECGEYSVIPDGYFRPGMVYGYQLEPIIDSGRTVVEFEVGVSPWVPEHLREKREQPATEEPGLAK